MGLISRISDQYNELCNAIIRPPRDRYRVDDIGPRHFPIGKRRFQRTDFVLTNPRGYNLACSHFEPVEAERISQRLPVVVYMHGNCSSRVEALVSLGVLLPQNITVFAFDFAGCGLSDGEHVSLGWFERDDLATVIDHLRQTQRVLTIGLWGRSMGAVTALMHASRDPSIASMVIDSPFSNMRKLAEELADVYLSWKLPKFLVNAGVNMLKSSVQTRAHFDLDKLSPIEHVSNTYIPALFISAVGDGFIKPHHTKHLVHNYAGDKNHIEVEGDHNSARPQFLHDSVSIFFHNSLLCNQIRPERHILVDDLWPSCFSVMNKQQKERHTAVPSKDTDQNTENQGYRRRGRLRSCLTDNLLQPIDIKRDGQSHANVDTHHPLSRSTQKSPAAKQDQSDPKNMRPPETESFFAYDDTGKICLIDAAENEQDAELVMQHNITQAMLEREAERVLTPRPADKKDLTSPIKRSLSCEFRDASPIAVLVKKS